MTQTVYRDNTVIHVSGIEVTLRRTSDSLEMSYFVEIASMAIGKIIKRKSNICSRVTHPWRAYAITHTATLIGEFYDDKYRHVLKDVQFGGREASIIAVVTAAMNRAVARV